MKKILFTLSIIITSLSVFSQSFSVDNKSLSVPRYANQTAITAAIPSPTVGMLVYDNALNQYAYYNGSAWTNFPSSSGGGSNSNLWSLNQTTGRIEANPGAPAGIEASRFTSNSTTSVTSPLINYIGNASTFLRYGHPQGNWAILQESTTGFSSGNTSLNWRYYDNSVPQAITHLFGYSSNTFNVTGALAATGVSSLRGKVTVGTTTTSGNGVEIQSSSSTVASPDVYIKSNNNIIRFGGITGNAGIMESVLTSATPSSSSMAWVHLDNNTTPTQTTMMTLTGAGNLTTAGFTKLGGFGTDVPAIKTKILTGNITPAPSTGNETATTLTTNVTHGVNYDKIIDVKVLLKSSDNLYFAERYSDNRPTPGGTNGYEFTYLIGASQISIIRSNGNSSRLATPGGYFAPYKIFITYIE